MSQVNHLRSAVGLSRSPQLLHSAKCGEELLKFVVCLVVVEVPHEDSLLVAAIARRCRWRIGAGSRRAACCRCWGWPS